MPNINMAKTIGYEMPKIHKDDWAVKDIVLCHIIEVRIRNGIPVFCLVRYMCVRSRISMDIAY